MKCQQTLVNLEENNFWFTSRNQLIQWVIRTYYPTFQNFLEIGCGTGFVLKGIANQFPHATLFGSELFSAGLQHATTRVPSAQLFQMDARHIPFDNEFDVIGAFDVLEHIEDDKTVLMQLHQALRDQAILIITVPQHPWLWSTTDELACHVRRYTAQDIHQKLIEAKFGCIRSSSFVSTLLPFMLLSRWRKQSEKDDASSELTLPPILNQLFYQCLSFERWCIKKGGNFPVGGSRLIVARKIS